jgi:type I restriction enzyme R subunit
VEHAIRHHLEVELNDDPDLQASFAEALARIFEQFRDNWENIYAELEALRRRIVCVDQEPTYGLHRKKQMPFFRCLKNEIFGAPPIRNSSSGTAPKTDALETAGKYHMRLDEEKIAALVDLTQQVFLAVERELKLVSFWENISARNRLKADIQNILLQPPFVGMPRVCQNLAQIITRVMEIAEKNNDIILRAE